MIQTWALLVDAYRELNAKKLFWLVMGLSGLFVLCFACIGINQKGMTVLIWDIPIPILNSNVMTKALFYRMTFIAVGIGIWLAWAATILALISTAGIFPDFLAGGSIELTLSKPIGRLRLFLTKYMTGLLFVAIQVSVFTAASFLVIGLRGQVWDPKIFWAVPLVLSFFSYLYSFSVLVALLTRSTMGAFLVTLLLWCLVFVVHLAEGGIVLQFKIRSDQLVALQQTELDTSTAKLEAAKAALQPADQDEPQPPASEPGNGPPTDDAKAKNDERIAKLEANIAKWNERLDESRKDQRLLTRIHAIAYAVKTVLPKTTETVDLLRRTIVQNTELESFQDQISTVGPQGGIENVGGVRLSNRAVQREMQRVLDGRSVLWVVGTSLAFEAVLLAIGGWIFCRRDF